MVILTYPLYPYLWWSLSWLLIGYFITINSEKYNLNAYLHRFGLGLKSGLAVNIDDGSIVGFNNGELIRDSIKIVFVAFTSLDGLLRDSR